MALNERIKLYLGITHNKLDNEIGERIASCERELVRLGVSSSKATSGDELIKDAIIAFVCMWMASDKDEREGWERSWQIISTALKDSSGYREELNNDV